MGYNFEDFVHDQGLSMREFNELYPETRKQWREVYEKKQAILKSAWDKFEKESKDGNELIEKFTNFVNKYEESRHPRNKTLA